MTYFKGYLMSLFGLFIMLVGTSMIGWATVAIFATTLLFMIGINIVLPTMLAGLLGLTGILAWFFGLRMVLKNENAAVRWLLGVFGIVVILVGGALAVAGLVPTGGASLLVFFVALAMGIAFVELGFNVKIIPIVGKLLRMAGGRPQ